MRSILMLFIFAAVMAAQPQFIRNYDVAAHTNLSVRNISPWLVEITNTSGREIVALTVKYDYHLTLENGIESGSIAVLHKAQNGPGFMPGAAYTFRPSQSDKQLKDLQTLATKVTISIDAVAFSPDEIVGPDSAGLGERLAAESKAFLRIKRELAEASRSGRQNEYIESLAATRPVQSGNADPRDDMRCGACWESVLRWSLGTSLKHSSHEERVNRIQELTK